MEWWVWRYDINRRQIVEYNVLRNHADSIRKQRKKCSREEFDDWLRSEMKYYYWSKSEHEMVISSFGLGSEGEKKIDVFDQLELNWPRFVDYCWEEDNEKRVRIYP